MDYDLSRSIGERKIKMSLENELYLKKLKRKRVWKLEKKEKEKVYKLQISYSLEKKKVEKS